MAIKLHRAGYEQAEGMIKRGLELETISNNWHEVAPDADDKLHFLKAHNMDEYGRWFLGVESEKPANDSSRFVYPYGDFDVVQESGLIAAHEQATKSNHADIAAAAQELLKKIDHCKKSSKCAA